MSFTERDYRVAAKIAREAALDDAAEAWEAQAAALKKWEQYALELGLHIHDSSYSAVVRGTRVLSKLLRDGWTPPEGLI